MRYIIFILVLFLMFQCFDNEFCGTCRVYEYEYDGLGNFRKATIDDKLYCGENYKNEISRDTLSDGWIIFIQKECN